MVLAKGPEPARPRAWGLWLAATVYVLWLAWLTVMAVMHKVS
jgi:hypothetical protein